VAQAKVDNDNENLISAAFLNRLAAELAKTPVSDTDRRYNAWQPIDPYHMYTIAAATGMVAESSQVMPASVLIFEKYEDTTIRAYWNDVEFAPVGCVLG